MHLRAHGTSDGAVHSDSVAIAFAPADRIELEASPYDLAPLRQPSRDLVRGHGALPDREAVGVVVGAVPDGDLRGPATGWRVAQKPLRSTSSCR